MSVVDVDEGFIVLADPFEACLYRQTDQLALVKVAKADVEGGGRSGFC